MTTTYFGPPTPSYNNPPIAPQNFKPSRFVISDIDMSQRTSIIVTTTTDHNYIIGQLVRLLIPNYFGASQLNEQSGYVVSVPTATEVTLDISAINVNPFVPSPSYGPTPPQILALGDKNNGLVSSTGRSLPSTTIAGAFQNISPQ